MAVASDTLAAQSRTQSRVCLVIALCACYMCSLLPTPESIAAAAAALGPRTPADERLTLVNAPGTNAYPLINYEYAVVSVKQSSPEIATALRRFLLWAIAPDETNEKHLADAHFIPLPAHIWVLSHHQIETIK